MSSIATANSDRTAELVRAIARRHLVAEKSLLLFSDRDDLLTRLFQTCRHKSIHVLSAGHASPDIAIAADRAELRVEEIIGASPFAGNIDELMPHVRHDSLVYLANPNRITGANYSLADIEMLSKALPFGTVIVDEYYYDFFGISAAPLIERTDNVYVLRSLAASFGVGSADAGFVIGTPAAIESLNDSLLPQSLSTTIYRLITTVLENGDNQAKRLKMLHDESLRLATVLTHLGVQNRITATDFLLLRVADTKSVGNFLARSRVPIENLDGYPKLNNYLRYRIQSELSNNLLIDAFSKMPAEYYRMDSVDRRKVIIRRRLEDQPSAEPVAAEPTVVPRKRVAVALRESETVTK